MPGFLRVVPIANPLGWVTYAEAGAGALPQGSLVAVVSGFDVVIDVHARRNATHKGRDQLLTKSHGVVGCAASGILIQSNSAISILQ
jgi:hypothetical protein